MESSPAPGAPGRSEADPLARLARLEGVASAFAAARDGIDVVLRDRGLRRSTPDQTTESLLRGAHASAVLEGSASSLDAVREGRGDDVAADAVRLSTEVLGQAPVLDRSPLQALARLHAVAGRGSLPADRLGRPRDADAARRLRGVAAVLTTPTTAPALLIAAVVHAEIATSAPFPSHNGLVARAAERLVLVARGVDEKSLVVPEAAHLTLRGPYESNLRGWDSASAPAPAEPGPGAATGPRGTAGLPAWLLYAAEAYAAAAEASPVHG